MNNMDYEIEDEYQNSSNNEEEALSQTSSEKEPYESLAQKSNDLNAIMRRELAERISKIKDKIRHVQEM